MVIQRIKLDKWKEFCYPLCLMKKLEISLLFIFLEDINYIGCNLPVTYHFNCPFHQHQSNVLEVHSFQHFEFQEGDPPPWYDLQAERYDRPYTQQEEDELRHKYRKNPALFEKRKLEGIIGYIGKPKGLKQILWERGLYVEGMKCHQTDTENMKKVMDGKEGLPEHLDMKRVLAKQPDFLAEKCAIQQLIEDRGHIFLKSPVCHPELAGHGIEYCWGYASTIFRRINDGTASNFESNVANSLSAEHLTLERVWKYARRTRDYMRMYQKLSQKLVDNPELKDQLNHKMYEVERTKVKTEARTLACSQLLNDFLNHAVQEHTCHRNISELDRDFIRIT